MCSPHIEPMEEDDFVDIKDLSYRSKLAGTRISTQFKDIKNERFIPHFIMLTKHFESQHTGNFYSYSLFLSN